MTKNNEEEVLVVDRENKIIGSVPRSEMRAKRLGNRAAYTLVFNEAGQLFDELIALKHKYGWKSALRMTTWTPETEGYSILVYPNGETFAWPVYDAEDKVEPIGNLKELTIQEIWSKYRFKRNHLRKYLGKSIRTHKTT